MLTHVAVCGIGLGHASRSLAVARELERRGHSVSFSAYGQALPYLKANGYNASKVPDVSYGVGGDGSISVKKTIVRNMLLPVRFAAQVASEIAIIQQTHPDIVLADTRASAVVAAKLLNKPTALILNQYNIVLETKSYKRFARLSERALQAPQLVWDSADLIIIPDLPPPYTISARTLNLRAKALNKARYVGPILEDGVKVVDVERVREEFGCRGRPLVLVVVSGGVEEKASLVNKFMSIAPQLDPEICYVMSTSMPHGNKTYTVGGLKLYEWIEDLESLLHAADLVISRSGLTLISKCIALGKKMVLIPTPLHGEQKANAARTEELGVAKVLENEELEPRMLNNLVREVLSDVNMDGAVKNLMHFARNLGGSGEAARLLEELYLNISANA
jgi:UDP-N-acetylglucosamine--N-acetylmuramyl-(pentapeptide) pyrophosphoryl-undecaprenol N-acetylglucosamine transferase